MVIAKVLYQCYAILSQYKRVLAHQPNGDALLETIACCNLWLLSFINHYDLPQDMIKVQVCKACYW